ncbi:MAG: NusG domain II-containing protein [Eubacteriales bacterium]|nr:NusG domain II-containing protein [Eubacteriales bacterium]
MKKKRNTIIFTAVILAAALAGLLAQRIFMKKGGNYAVVQSCGEVIARLDLTENTVLTVGGETSGRNRIEVAEGTVCVTEADCPDQICVHQGRISRRGEVIACLPHELIITIDTDDDSGADDAAW